ncbi:hypothetical protein [Streptomyces sp. NPDC051662]|uniref:hypothetical protein n=1 Tax=Streptomyces sp. NPDC051662 TaxID=3154750 RepID=UPI003425754B
MSQPPPQGGIIRYLGGIVDDVKEAVNRLIERAAELEDRFQAAFISLLEGNAEGYASMPSRRSAGEGGRDGGTGWPSRGNSHSAGGYRPPVRKFASIWLTR